MESTPHDGNRAVAAALQIHSAILHRLSTGSRTGVYLAVGHKRIFLVSCLMSLVPSSSFSTSVPELVEGLCDIETR